MRQRDYPGSDMEIEQELARGSNYRRYIASYESDGLKIYGLLTVPEGEKLPTGWPVIIFNHGYIPPSVYRTTERYVAYVDALARSGYIVFKPDYRGHANSEGVARGGYETPDYAIDVLNALASLKRYKDADSNRIGMWGHSMGGQLTLRSLVVSKDIKAAVIWAGVVAPYADLIEQWKLPVGGDRPHPALTSWRDAFLAEYGSPQGNPDFWASISPSSYATDITAPVQVHHGSADEDVPMSFSDGFVKRMQDAGKAVEYFTYPGDNHNLSVNFSTAMRRTIAFFDSYLKGE
jgi:dipeptidyl aminopeptidase/acylaminoacyl peptidase